MKQKTIRYGKPCMTNLPPKLGRMIFNEIMNPPPFDYTELDRQCRLVEEELAELGRQASGGKDEVAGK